MRYTTVRAALSTVVLMLLLQASAPVFRAQTPIGNILGTVRDSGGGVIPGVNVSAKSVETGAVRSATTDSSGAYQILNLSGGFYDVEARSEGFKTQVRKGVAVTVGATVTVNFTLSVGDVQETVEVKDVPPQLETTTPAMGGLVGETAVRELPLNGRDWLQLATLQAGVVGGIGQQSAADFTNSRAARGNGVALSISGNRPTGNVFLVDGLVVNDYANASPGSGLNVNLGVEAVREFRVLTNEYAAENGRSTGGVVTAVFKSGTNQFHGSIFEFLRNSALDSKNFFDDPTKPIPQFQRNQFGGSAGGPIKKNKTFFFGDYEELREVKGISHASNTLSPNARKGILKCPSVGPVPPGSGCTIPPVSGSTYTVPIASSIRPYLAFFPVSNGPISGDTAKFIFAGKLIGVERYVIGKVDHNLSDVTTLSGSYQLDNTDESQPDPYNQKRTGSPSRHQNSVLTLQHIFSPKWLNTARMGFSRTHATDALDLSAIDPIAADTSLGFQPGVPAGIISVAGLTGTQGGLGSSGADILNYTSFQWGDDASWIKGRNTFKFGGIVERIRYNKNSLVGAPIGEFDFGTVSDFLQGIPSQFRTDVPGTDDIRGLRTTYLGFYFQDGIAVRRNLHVNVGMRYEYVSPTTEAFGRVAVLPTLASATPRTGGAYFDTNTKNFAPRLGITWDPTGSGKTSIRTGFGIYDVLSFPYLMENRTNSFPFFEEGTINSPPPSSFPKGGLALITPSSLRASFVEPNPQRAYMMQWNLTIQRQLAANAAFTLGYVGSRGNHLPRSIEDANQVPPSLVTRAADGHLLFPTTGKIQRINSSFSRIATTVWDDFSTYHGLMVDFNKRYSRGFFFKAAYTWSKSIDEGSNTFSDNESTNTSGSPYAFFPSIQKGASEFDITHRVVVNYSWNIPTPESFSGVSRAFWGGWVLGGIFTAQTGPPFSVTLRNDQARTGDSRVGSSSGGQRPDFNPAPGCTPNAINPGQPSNYLHMQCFAFPALGVLGNLGRNTLRGPGLEEFDFSLFKNWPLWQEKMRLQFRAEFFNLFNHVNLQAPKVKVFDNKGNPDLSAGVLPSPTLTTEREIQFGLKLTW
jgi:Carboxypeptidase regulatory-like domain